MPDRTADSRMPFGQPLAAPSILLASDSVRHGNSMHQMLAESGFAVEYAGDYSRLEPTLEERPFDVVLLEVSGEDAVEPAVAAALRVKRANSGQFVGYVADAELSASGLAGDAVFPRSRSKLAEALRSFFVDEEERRPGMG